MRASPFSSTSRLASSSFTGKPKSAKLMAMPPPMVPAPTTAAVAISGSARSFGSQGILATSRSAKKA